MPIDLRVYANASDCFVIWKTEEIAGCLGFAIQRERAGEQEYLPNRLGFLDEQVAPGATRPSTEWPFQRYDWTDHGVATGDEVRYRIVPVIQAGGGAPVPNEAGVSAWSATIKLTADAGNGMSAYFNRGILLSQFVARALGGEITTAKLKQLKTELGDDADKLRLFLGGDILKALTALLGEVAADTRTEVYGALYELEDDQLIALLKQIGKRVHLILANGSDKSGDGNSKAAQALAGSEVDLHRRMLKSRGLGHNKFLVVERDGKPVKLLTGSTNWATTGLCTQVNNALVVSGEGADGAAILQEYRHQWDELLRAADAFPSWLKTENSRVRGPARGAWSLWFTPTPGHDDLTWAGELIEKATESIHFLMFTPGTDGLLQPVLQAQTERPDLVVFGVVNDLNPPRTSGSGEALQTVKVSLISPDFARQFPLEVIEPEGVRKGLGPWMEEVTRRDFLGPSPQFPTIGHAIIHSKVLVIDGLTDHPVVVTGSHNFSKSASEHNDENLIVIRGNRALAQKYLVEINAVYAHYRWRAYLKDHNNVRSGLERTPDWQKRKLGPATLAAMRFWVR